MSITAAEPAGERFGRGDAVGGNFFLQISKHQIDALQGAFGFFDKENIERHQLTLRVENFARAKLENKPGRRCAKRNYGHETDQKNDAGGPYSPIWLLDTHGIRANGQFGGRLSEKLVAATPNDRSTSQSQAWGFFSSLTDRGKRSRIRNCRLTGTRINVVVACTPARKQACSRCRGFIDQIGAGVRTFRRPMHGRLDINRFNTARAFRSGWPGGNRIAVR